MPWNKSFLLIVVLLSCKSSPLTSRKGCFCELIVMLLGAKRAAFRGCYQCFWGLVFCKWLKYNALQIWRRIENFRPSIPLAENNASIWNALSWFFITIDAQMGLPRWLARWAVVVLRGYMMMWIGRKESEDMSKLTHPHPIDSLIQSTMCAKCSL